MSKEKDKYPNSNYFWILIKDILRKYISYATCIYRCKLASCTGYLRSRPLARTVRATRSTFRCFWPQRCEVAEGVRRCGVRCGNLSVSFRLATAGKKNYSMTATAPSGGGGPRSDLSSGSTSQRTAHNRQLNFVAKYFVVQNELQRKHRERVCEREGGR